MKRPSLSRSLAAAALVALAGWGGLAAYKKGDTAFAKRFETSLLAEPKPLAPAAGKVGFAEQLSIEEVRGPWLRVKGKKVTGWVFEGNVAADKPSLPPTAGLTTVEASSTHTVAAARPMTEVGEAYAERHDAVKSREDVDWLDAQAKQVDADAVETYLRENKKGEYRP